MGRFFIAIAILIVAAVGYSMLGLVVLLCLTAMFVTRRRRRAKAALAVRPVRPVRPLKQAESVVEKEVPTPGYLTRWTLKRRMDSAREHVQWEFEFNQQSLEADMPIPGTLGWGSPLPRLTEGSAA